MSTRFFSFLSFVLLITFSSISAQEVGEVFSAKEANNRYGRVVESKSFSTSIVKEWINSTDDKIMFNLVNNDLTVLRDTRELVYSTSKYLENNEEFHMFSKNKLTELINKGGSSTTYFENRNNVFSITNGEYTLETSLPCPPGCN